MDVRNDMILSYGEDNIENLSLVPKHVERSRMTLKIEKITKRLLEVLGGFLRSIGINTINDWYMDS